MKKDEPAACRQIGLEFQSRLCLSKPPLGLNHWHKAIKPKRWASSGMEPPPAKG
jgi:hypothetical protein